METLRDLRINSQARVCSNMGLNCGAQLWGSIVGLNCGTGPTWIRLNVAPVKYETTYPMWRPSNMDWSIWNNEGIARRNVCGHDSR